MTRSNRERVADRLAVTEALIRLMDHWEEVGCAISGAEDRPGATRVLTGPPHSFTPIAAEFVMDFPIGRRTLQARRELEDERRLLRDQLTEA